MTALARVLVQHARWVLAATLVITLSAASMMPRLAFNADVTSFLLEGSEAGRALAALQAKYATSDPITVLLERDDGGVFTDREGLAALARVRDALRAVPGVASIGTALPDEVPIVGVATTPDLLASLPAFALGPLLAGPGADLLLADDGRLAMAVVLAEDDPLDLVVPLRATHLPVGIRATFAGSPVVYAEVLGLLGWFLLAIPPLVLGLLLAVFAVTLGSLRHAALALLPALLGSLWTFGLIFGLGLRVDVLTVIVPVFVIVMGSADGLHLVSHLQGAAARGIGRVARVAAALREVGLPMVLTTVSTAVGFLSLVATDLRPVRQLGTFVAVGIVLAGLISLLALPALLSRLEIGAPRRRANRDPVTCALIYVAERRWTAFALAAPLLIFVALFLPRLDVDPDQLFFFEEGHVVRRGYERIEAAFGGAAPVFGEFAIDRALPLEPQLLSLRDRSRELEALPGVHRVVSVADIVTEVPVAARRALLDGDLVPPLGPMVSDDGLRFVLFPGPHTAADVQGWLRAAGATPEIRTLSGTPVLFDQLSRAIVRAQTVSLASAFALVAALLLLTYRRLSTALLALLPLALGVATMLAFLAASGIHLNLITAVASSIVIGVGIDYAIHLIAAMEHALRERPGEDGWVRRALETAGRPIVANALGVPIGLTALLISPLAPHGHIAALMWAAMLTSAAAALVIIPAFAPRRGLRGPVAAAPGGSPEPLARPQP
jgi:uncharacterized protein